MPRKKKNKNKKTIILLIFLLIVIFGLLYFIFILVNKKALRQTGDKKQIPFETSQSKISIQEESIEEEFDKDRFCEREGPEMLEYIEELEAIMDKAVVAFHEKMK